MEPRRTGAVPLRGGRPAVPLRAAISQAAEVAQIALAEARPAHRYSLDWLAADNPRPQATLFRARPEQGGQGLVVKVVPADLIEVSRLAAQFRRQRQAWRSLQDNPRFRVPRAFHLGAAGRAMVMEDARGQTFAQLWAVPQPEATRHEHLHRIGGWIGCYHGISLAEAAFDPAPHLHWIEKLTAEAEPQALSAVAPRLAALSHAAETARGRPALAAITHRDLHLKNLILRPDGRTYGIDLENARTDVALRDLQFVLLDAAARAEAEDQPMRLVAFASRLWRGYRTETGTRLRQSREAALFFQRFQALAALAALRDTQQSALMQRRRALLAWLCDLEEPLFGDL